MVNDRVAYAYVFTLAQIAFERFVPRISPFTARLRGRYKRRTVVAEVVDVEEKGLEEGGREGECKEEQGDGSKERENDVKLQKALDARVEFRNDFTFACYKATLTSSVIIGLIESREQGWRDVVERLLWKFGMFLGIEVLLEGVVMALERGYYGVPVGDFEALDVVGFCKQFLFGAFHGVVYFAGAKELFGYG
ncbi:hypothetical protein HDU97_008529 [Phlyctochytrium planicorne]|nr:hypothetical protein HDU97_008529 [Phlyctochytrium planicorne]